MLCPDVVIHPDIFCLLSWRDLIVALPLSIPLIVNYFKNFTEIRTKILTFEEILHT